jgi:protein TonB
VTWGGLKPDIGIRIASFLLSGALHLAAGLALFYTSDDGVPLRGPVGGDSGQVLVIELIPLDRAGGTPGDSDADQDGREAKAALTTPPPGPEGSPDIQLEPRASGPATSDLAASSEEAGDAREMADLPSSEVLAYRQRLESHLARYRVYPTDARTAGRQGVVTVHFTMTRDGHVLESWVETSSGVSDLDAEALAAILRAQPLPVYPRDWPGRLDVSLPVTFRLG